MRLTLDVYEDRDKPKYRVRVVEGFSLKTLDLTGSWVVVPTEDGGEVGVSLLTTTRFVIRERSERDEADYQNKTVALAVAQ